MIFEWIRVWFNNYKTYRVWMAGKGTPLSKALSQWEEKNNGKPAAEAEEIKLIFLVLSTRFRIPPSTNWKQVSWAPSPELKNFPFLPTASIKSLTSLLSNTSPACHLPATTSRRSQGLNKSQEVSRNCGFPITKYKNYRVCRCAWNWPLFSSEVMVILSRQQDQELGWAWQVERVAWIRKHTADWKPLLWALEGRCQILCP